jgi:hypothetical protein
VGANVDDQKRLDDDLAALTDAILENRMVEPTEDAQDYEPVVRQLQQIIRPDSEPTPVFRDRLTQRLNEEWSMSRAQKSRNRFSNRSTRLVVLAASVAIVLTGVALLVNNPVGVPVGTAIGDNSNQTSGVILLVLGVIGTAVGVALWRRNR